MKTIILVLAIGAFAAVFAQRSGRHTVNFQHYWDLDEVSFLNCENFMDLLPIN